MADFVFLFRGGLVPVEKREQCMKDWGEWMGKLGESGKLKGGDPFHPDGSKVVSGDGGVKDYDWHVDSNVGGYTVVEAADIDEAVELSKDCPHMFEDYGSGTVEVRVVMKM